MAPFGVLGMLLMIGLRWVPQPRQRVKGIDPTPGAAESPADV
jgi:hypothetical protein